MKARITAIVKENDSVKTLILSPDERKEFVPGQFLMAYRPFNERRTARAYSISSMPNEDISITFKHYDDGVLSPYLWEREVGDEIEIEYPFGHFKLIDGKAAFVCAGTGIAPIRSMALFCKRSNRPFKTLVSFRNEKDVIFSDDLNDMNADVIFTSKRERISKSDLENLDDDSVFYICGSPEMVNSVKDMLLEIGVPEERIKLERW